MNLRLHILYLLVLCCSLSLLNRCVPDLLDPSNKNITASIIEFLNEDDDIFRKVLSDLFYSWKEMLALCFIALGESTSSRLYGRLMLIPFAVKEMQIRN